MHIENIAIHAGDATLQAAAAQLAGQLHLPVVDAQLADSYPLLLQLTPQHLQLQLTGPAAPGPVYVDFVGGAVGHRRRFGGGKSQPIAKAVGLKAGTRPTVLDATAGLGRDAFVLASLGCQVTLVERSPVIAALLQDGITRAKADPELAGLFAGNMTLINQDAVVYMQQLADDLRPDVIYLDPMYPHRGKSALVKKEMRLFQVLLGEANLDNCSLLEAALQCARKRVVVKRPKGAERISERAPTMEISSKNTRYDVYVIRAMGADC